MFCFYFTRIFVQFVSISPNHESQKCYAGFPCNFRSHDAPVYNNDDNHGVQKTQSTFNCSNFATWLNKLLFGKWETKKS